MIVAPSKKDAGGDDEEQYQADQPMSIHNLNNIQRGILGNTFNPHNDATIRNKIITKTNQNNNSGRTNIYDGNSGSNLNRVNNNFPLTNHGLSVNTRSTNESVQIITKNGHLTKKPNIIGSEYIPNHPPDHIYATNKNNNPSNNNNNHHHYGFNPSNNYKNDFDTLKPSTSSSLADRKSTCMLYLQADHTFYQKMGSDEASIEAITRHVQRANIIYRNTGELDGKTKLLFFM